MAAMDGTGHLLTLKVMRVSVRLQHDTCVASK